MDEVPQAAEPLDVVFRVVAVLVAPGGFYEAVLFVKPESLVGCAYQLGNNADWVEWGACLFFFAYLFFYFLQFVSEVLW